jgi:hypothetical protein
MKKILNYLFLVVNFLIINKLQADNNEIYKLEKNSLKELYTLEPKYASIDIPINKIGNTKKFILKKSEHLNKDFKIISNDGKIFKDKSYLGVTYEIHDGIEGNYVGHLMAFENFTKCSFNNNDRSFIITSDNDNNNFKINSEKINLEDNYKNITDLMKNFNKNKELNKALEKKTKENLKNVVKRIEKNKLENDKSNLSENQSKIFDLNELNSIGNISSSPQKANAPPAGATQISEIFIVANQPLVFSTEGDGNHELVTGDKIDFSNIAATGGNKLQTLNNGTFYVSVVDSVFFTIYTDSTFKNAVLATDYVGELYSGGGELTVLGTTTIICSKILISLEVSHEYLQKMHPDSLVGGYLPTTLIEQRNIRTDKRSIIRIWDRINSYLVDAANIFNNESITIEFNRIYLNVTGGNTTQTNPYVNIRQWVDRAEQNTSWDAHKMVVNGNVNFRGEDGSILRGFTGPPTVKGNTSGPSYGQGTKPFPIVLGLLNASYIRWQKLANQTAYTMSGYGGEKVPPPLTAENSINSLADSSAAESQLPQNSYFNDASHLTYLIGEPSLGFAPDGNEIKYYGNVNPNFLQSYPERLEALQRYVGGYRTDRTTLGGYSNNVSNEYPNNFFPIYSNMQLSRNNESGCHTHNIGISYNWIGSPTFYTRVYAIGKRKPVYLPFENPFYEYAYQKDELKATKGRGVINWFGEMDYYLTDYQDIGSPYAAQIKNKWKLKDHKELFGEKDEYGQTDYPPFNIEKLNKWMLVMHIANSLGARYFSEENEPNTILSPASTGTMEDKSGRISKTNIMRPDAFEYAYPFMFNGPHNVTTNHSRPDDNTFLYANKLTSVGLNNDIYYGIHFFIDTYPLQFPSSFNSVQDNAGSFRLIGLNDEISVLQHPYGWLKNHMLNYDCDPVKWRHPKWDSESFNYLDWWDIRQTVSNLSGQSRLSRSLDKYDWDIRIGIPYAPTGTSNPQFDPTDYGLTYIKNPNARNVLQSKIGISTPDFVSFGKGFGYYEGASMRALLTNPDVKTAIGATHNRPHAKIKGSTFYATNGDTLDFEIADTIDIEAKWIQYSPPNCLGDSREFLVFDTVSERNTYTWNIQYPDGSSLNNFIVSNNPSTATRYRKIKFAIPQNYASGGLKPIYIKLGTKNAANCSSNLAIKQLIVYPKIETPITNAATGTRIINLPPSLTAYTTKSYTYANWEFKNKYSSSSLANEDKVLPSTYTSEGRWEHGVSPLGDFRLMSGTGWSSAELFGPFSPSGANSYPSYLMYQPRRAQKNADDIKYMDSNEALYGETSPYFGGYTAGSHFSPFKHWYTKEGFYTTNPNNLGQIGFKNRLSPQTLNNLNEVGYLNKTWPGQKYPLHCGYDYWRNGITDTARSPIYTNKLTSRNNNELGLYFDISSLGVGRGDIGASEYVGQVGNRINAFKPYNTPERRGYGASINTYNGTTVTTIDRTWPGDLTLEEWIYGKTVNNKRITQRSDTLLIYGYFNSRKSQPILLYKKGGDDLAVPTYKIYKTVGSGANLQTIPDESKIDTLPTLYPINSPLRYKEDEWKNEYINLSQYDTCKTMQFDFVYKNANTYYNKLKGDIDEADPGSIQSRTFIKRIRIFSDTVLKLCKQKSYFTGLVDICPYPLAGCVPCSPSKKLPVRLVIPAGHNATSYRIYYKIINFNDSTTGGTTTGFTLWRTNTINNTYNSQTNTYSPNSEIVFLDSINFVGSKQMIVFMAEVLNTSGFTDIEKVYNTEYGSISEARINNSCPSDFPKTPILSVDSVFGRNLTTKLRITLPAQHNIDRFEIYRVTASNALRNIAYIPTGSVPSYITNPQFTSGFTAFSNIKPSNNNAVTFNLRDSIYGYWQQGQENGTYTGTPPCNINCWLFNQCPNSTPNGCADGEYKYRIIVYPTNTTLSSFILDFPITTICNACPGRPTVKLSVQNAQVEQISQFNTINNQNFSSNDGTYRLTMELNNLIQPRVNKIEIYEAKDNPTAGFLGTLIKTIDTQSELNNPFGTTRYIHDINGNTNGTYKYTVKAYNGELTFISNVIFIKVTGNANLCLGSKPQDIDFRISGPKKFLKFDFNIKGLKTGLVCNLESFRLSYYKLGNLVSQNLLAANSNLSSNQVASLPLGPVQYSNVTNNITKCIKFAPSEIINNKFSRIATPTPTIGNSWYRMELECLSCGANPDKKIIKYFYVTN